VVQLSKTEALTLQGAAVAVTTFNGFPGGLADAGRVIRWHAGLRLTLGKHLRGLCAFAVEELARGDVFRELQLGAVDCIAVTTQGHKHPRVVIRRVPELLCPGVRWWAVVCAEEVRAEARRAASASAAEAEAQAQAQGSGGATPILHPPPAPTRGAESRPESRPAWTRWAARALYGGVCVALVTWAMVARRLSS
jgi:hypothetical protein